MLIMRPSFQDPGYGMTRRRCHALKRYTASRPEFKLDPADVRDLFSVWSWHFASASRRRDVRVRQFDVFPLRMCGGAWTRRGVDSSRLWCLCASPLSVVVHVAVAATMGSSSGVVD